jgi:heme-degrading monooxygenase HmoA
MFARLTTLQFKVEGIDEAIKIYKENIIPAIKSQRGYQGLNFFLNRETGQGASITLWETKEAAIANEQSRYYQEQIVKHMHLYTKPPIRERYEVIFQD